MVDDQNSPEDNILKLSHLEVILHDPSSGHTHSQHVINRWHVVLDIDSIQRIKIASYYNI